MKTTTTIRWGMGVLAVLGLAACGGGGGGGGGTSGATTATGYFRDSDTQGLTYVSGSQTGVTGADGTFTYEVGKTVTFSIGGVTLGTVDGAAVITPVDLVSGGTSTTAAVQNIVRFLMMLDKDGNPSNGIQISAAVQAAAKNWSQVNFSTTDLATAVAQIITDADTADGTTHTLPTAATAETHLETTLLCVHSGGYEGTYSGGDTGQFGVLVDAKTGLVTGVAYSNSAQATFPLSGTTAISYDQSAAFTTGSAGDVATFSGQFTSPDAVSGTWADNGDSLAGSFSGTRVGGSPNAVYRFTGTVSASGVTGATGLFTVDVDGSGNVTGDSYDVQSGNEHSVSGTLTGTTVTGTVADGDGSTFTGTLDGSTGAMSGTWSDPVTAEHGTFSGSGCKLN